MELLQKAASVAVLVFVVTSMVALGLGLTFDEIIKPLRNVRLVVLALVANFVVMPLAAMGLAAVLRLDEPLEVGLLLLGAAAGAPFLPSLAQMAKGNVAFAVGLMVMQLIVTVAYLPIAIPLMIPGVAVDSGRIALSLFVVMLLPLSVAALVKARWPVAVAGAKRVFDRVSSVSLILMVLLITTANFKSVMALLGTFGILAGFLFIAIGFGIGWLLGGPGSDTRRVLALGTASRNFSAALVVAGQAFSDPNVVVMVTVVAIINMVLLIPLARLLAKRG